MKSSFLASAIFLSIVATYSADEVWWECVGYSYYSLGSRRDVRYCEERTNQRAGGERGIGCCATFYNHDNMDVPASWAYRRDGLANHINDSCPFCFGLVKRCTTQSLFAIEVKDEPCTIL